MFGPRAGEEHVKALHTEGRLWHPNTWCSVVGVTTIVTAGGIVSLTLCWDFLLRSYITARVVRWVVWEASVISRNVVRAARASCRLFFTGNAICSLSLVCKVASRQEQA